jgi:DNA repair protein RecO (recombination protein O)
MLTKTEAIVLHALKYGESRLIVDLFTRDCGRLAVIVSLPKTSRGKFRKQLFQPLTLLNVEIDVRPKAQLQKLRDAVLLMPYTTMTTDARKLTIALFVAEFLYYALRGEQQNEPMFDYLLSGIEWLDNSTEHYANFHLVFLMRLSRFLGFYPNLEGYEPDCLFDLRASTFCRQAPLHSDYLAPAEAARVELMMRMDFATMHLFRLSRHDRGRLLDIILTYYRLHLPDFPELHSLAVLQELYGTMDAEAM